MTEILERYLPFFSKLTIAEKNKLVSAAHISMCQKGKALRNKREDCLGFVIVKSGRLRVYMNSDEGREITLYRLLEGDMCLFSASCAMSNIQFDVMLETEMESEVIIISPCVYKEFMDTCLPVAKYTSELLSSRLSEVMWLLDKVLNQRIDSRLASLLLEESDLIESEDIPLTQEQLANHLGTAREVVTRILRGFQSEGIVELKRGIVRIIKRDALNSMSVH